MMDCLEYFIDRCWEELDDSKEYTVKAMEHKDSHRRWADTLFQTAAQEFSHFEAFHDMAIALVAEAKEKHHEHAHYLEMRWQREQPKLTHRALKVKMLHDAYRK